MISLAGWRARRGGRAAALPRGRLAGIWDESKVVWDGTKYSSSAICVPDSGLTSAPCLTRFPPEAAPDNPGFKEFATSPLSPPVEQVDQGGALEDAVMPVPWTSYLTVAPLLRLVGA
jgi:hypothetical protein